MTKLQTTYLEKLEFLVGNWSTNDFIYPGFVGPGGTANGEVDFGWEMNDLWLAFSLKTELPGTGDYQVNGRMGYNTQAGYYQTVSWNSMNRMYTYRGDWKNSNELVYHLVHPKQRDNLWIIYEKITENKIHKSLEMRDGNGKSKRGYDMIFNKNGRRMNW